MDAAAGPQHDTLPWSHKATTCRPCAAVQTVGVVRGMESCGPGVSVGGFDPDLVIQSVEGFYSQVCSVAPWQLFFHERFPLVPWFLPAMTPALQRRGPAPPSRAPQGLGVRVPLSAPTAQWGSGSPSGCGPGGLSSTLSSLTSPDQLEAGCLVLSQKTRVRIPVGEPMGRSLTEER